MKKLIIPLLLLLLLIGCSNKRYELKLKLIYDDDRVEYVYHPSSTRHYFPQLKAGCIGYRENRRCGVKQYEVVNRKEVSK